MKGVGPIEYRDQGTYTFENIRYTKVFDYGTLRSIKVQYMDGSFKTIEGALLKKVIAK